VRAADRRRRATLCDLSTAKEGELAQNLTRIVALEMLPQARIPLEVQLEKLTTGTLRESPHEVRLPDLTRSTEDQRAPIGVVEPGVEE